MKRIFLYISLLMLSAILGYIIFRMKPDQEKKVLTVDTEYAYVMKDDAIGTFMMYVSDETHDICNENRYMRMILEDKDKETKIELSLLDIEIGHEEYYLKEAYVKVFISFDIPIMTEDIVFDDAYLTLELTDQQNYEVRLGRVTFFKDAHDEQGLNWTSLSGIKQSNDLRSRIYEITVSCDGVTEEIEKIDVGSKHLTTFSFDQQNLIITIEDADYLLYDVPIVITFVNGERQVIANFRYIIDYVILKESGPMINVYTLD